MRSNISRALSSSERFSRRTTSWNNPFLSGRKITSSVKLTYECVRDQSISMGAQYTCGSAIPPPQFLKKGRPSSHRYLIMPSRLGPISSQRLQEGSICMHQRTHFTAAKRHVFPSVQSLPFSTVVARDLSSCCFRSRYQPLRRCS
jgi:hypothetical protein